MKTKLIDFGTTRNVTVIEASKLLIACVDDNNEGYFLMNHEITDLPKLKSRGKITFTKTTQNKLTNGYWHFTPTDND